MHGFGIVKEEAAIATDDCKCGRSLAGVRGLAAETNSILANKRRHDATYIARY